MARLLPFAVPPGLRAGTSSLPVAFAVAAFVLLSLAVVSLRSSFDSPSEHNRLWASGSVGHDRAASSPSRYDRVDYASSEWTTGPVIMPKLGNATAKAELGRASWKLLHTMAARFPEEPTENERETFKSFLHIFSRLYPCGECAAEFQQLLRKYPPQTSSRGVASMYLCHLHNEVNERLGKDEFDCGENLKDIYDCGCGDDDGRGADGGESEKVDRGEASEAKRAEEPAKKANERPVVVLTEATRDPVTGLELVGG